VFSVLPAIDLTQGRLGMYTLDGPRPVDAFGGDALAAARAFADAGARWFHVVDMDLAFTGEPVNEQVIASIHEAHPGVSLQCSGGVRDRETVDRMLAAGAFRVVMGSAALADEDALSAIIGDLGDRVLVSVEVAEGRIRSRGRDPVDLDLMTSLGWLTAAGARGFVVTALALVGSKEGPDVGVIRRVARSGAPTMAAGGIGSLADLSAVRTAGASGAVVGQAAFEGSLDLREAFAWAQAH
jgi:phosphoribosylformimino-5-aminoimidazole carboxamide ribonucleotide (ProFAR) isomerase